MFSKTVLKKMVLKDKFFIVFMNKNLFENSIDL